MVERRSPGEGSIFQRKDSRWVAKLVLPDGKPKYLYSTKSRADVAKKLAAAKATVSQGIPLPNERLTVERFLDDWLDAVKPSLRATTHKRYSFDVRRISAVLGKRKLVDLTPQVVQKFLNDLHASGLSASSVSHCRAVLRSAMQQAEAWGMIARNPASEKRVRVPKGTKREAPPITPDLAGKIIATFEGDRFESLVMMALCGGLREGELLGLRWDDVDLDAVPPRLHVRNQLQRIGGERVLVEPKSDAGRRTVYLPAFVGNALRQHRVRQLEARMKAGARWHESGHVFTSTVGTPLEASNTVHRFQTKLVAAGLPKLRLHDLRHGTAALMEALGTAPKTRSDFLGHSQISLTLDVYTKSNPQLLSAVAAGMDTLLGPMLTGRQSAPMPVAAHELEP